MNSYIYIYIYYLDTPLNSKNKYLLPQKVSTRDPRSLDWMDKGWVYHGKS